ncbi:LruC domain-containing protein [Sphingobacterium sp. G1-14]|uniref:LruC domain-containing protein n=1 Tax=Sphingobacterium sp. G1-14 TaxID=2003121 RepID=UPI000B4950BA|nr:LruC domain-containing protein [Sphingobacterium sp. G1-14]
MYSRKCLNLFLVGLAGITLFGASCSKVKDLYNETDTGSDSSSLFPDGVSVPTDFMWSSARAVDVRVAVDDKFSGKYFYRVEIFDNDPALGAEANLLAAGQAKSGQDFVGKLMVPTVAKYIYLRETSPLGVAAISMVEVGQQNTISVDGTKAGSSSKASVLRGSTSSALLGSGGLKAAASTAEAATVVVPSDAVEINGNGSIYVESNKSYVIKSGVTFTGTINANNGSSNVKIYVQGVWKNTGNEFNLGGNNTLIVAQAGSIQLAHVTQNTNGRFENYGATSLSKMTTTNSSLYINYGTLDVNEATVTNGSFTNYGIATIQKLSSSTSGTIVRNEGTLTVNNADFTNATLEAVCHTTIKTMKTNGATISIASGSLLSLEDLNATGTKINLAASSILDVTTKVTFDTWSNNLMGPSSGQALARLKKVELIKGGTPITYSGNVEVACSDHTPNEQYNTYYVVNSPAKIVPYDKSTVVISGTSCNAGGNNAAGGNPNDQTVTEVKLGTYSYAFEDNWPSIGDYDMNDFVVDVAITKVQNSANKITKLKLVNKIRSVGAKNRLAAAIQLDGILATNVKSVKYTNENLVGQNLPLGSNGVESNQKYAVVTLCDDAHKAFGISDTQFISTQNGNFQPVESEITIEFTSPLDNFTFADLNSFIITNGYKVSSRTEIHLVGYKATDKMNKALVENLTAKGQLSANDPFRSSKGEPWGLCIPVSFVYPNEYKKITGVYPKFESWALSGGSQDTNWYVK